MIDQRFLDDLAQDLRLPEETQPEMQLASANTGVTTDGGAFVGYRMNMPKGLNTPENMAKQSTLIANTLGGGTLGGGAAGVGLAGDIVDIILMGANALGADMPEKSGLWTTEDVTSWLASKGINQENISGLIDKVFPSSATEEEKARAFGGGQTVGELAAPGTQLSLIGKAGKEIVKGGVKVGKKIIEAGKDLPVGMSIKMLDGTEQVLEQAPKITTKAFKNWFGDSKAVDDAGKPVVVYHSTRGQFDEFNTTGEGQSLNTGTFFSSSPDVAGTYNTSSEHSIVPAYLSLKNPVIVEGNGANWNKIGQDAKISLPEVKVSAKEDEMLLSELTGEAPNVDAMTTLQKRDTTAKELFGETVFEKGFSTNEIARWARSKGYDGVIFKNVVDHGPAVRFSTKEAEKPSNIYVAFEPTQIKSAIANKGTFDPKDPSILKGVGVGGTGAAMSQEENK